MFMEPRTFTPPGSICQGAIIFAPASTPLTREPAAGSSPRPFPKPRNAASSAAASSRHRIRADRPGSTLLPQENLELAKGLEPITC